MTNSVEDQEDDASYYAKPQTNYHCCLQFSFCFHALDWLFPCNTITFQKQLFYVHSKDVQVSAKVSAHLCNLPIAGYPR